MALMYDMETVNRAMTEATAFVSGPGVKLTSRERFVLNTFAGLKPVEAEPVVHAPWIETKDGGVCGRCRSGMKQYKRIRYLIAWCPFCGAKMDGRVEE